MTKNRIKVLFIAIIALSLFIVTGINRNAVQAVSKVDDTAADMYKTKCQACHSPKAEKSYDPAMPIDDQVNIILNGKKGEKPPYMPAFGTKDPPVTREQAKALAEYMKSLRTPAN